MKVFIFLACCLVAVNAGDESEEVKENVKELSELLKNKFNITIVDDLIKLFEKIDEKCPDIEEKLENAVEQVTNCIEEIELGSDTFCQLIRKNYIKCSKPVRSVIVGCLPEQSKDLPMLGEKIMGALLDQLCNSTVEEVLELFNPCVLEKDLDDVPECEKIEDVFRQHKNELPSKELVCETLPKLRVCAKAELDASCKNPVTKRAHISFYDAIEDATSDTCSKLNKACSHFILRRN